MEFQQSHFSIQEIAFKYAADSGPAASVVSKIEHQCVCSGNELHRSMQYRQTLLRNIDFIYSEPSDVPGKYTNLCKPEILPFRLIASVEQVALISNGCPSPKFKISRKSRIIFYIH